MGASAGFLITADAQSDNFLCSTLYETGVYNEYW